VRRMAHDLGLSREFGSVAGSEPTGSRHGSAERTPQQRQQQQRRRRRRPKAKAGR
jgi:hypothetical protein